MWMLEKEIDHLSTLNKLVTPATKFEKGRTHTLLETSYGVTFYEAGLGDTFFYQYDSDLIGLSEEEEGNGGALSGNDIVEALKILEKDPNKLRNKPKSIMELEKLTGKSAFRTTNGFG